MKGLRSLSYDNQVVIPEYTTISPLDLDSVFFCKLDGNNNRVSIYNDFLLNTSCKAKQMEFRRFDNEFIQIYFTADKDHHYKVELTKDQIRKIYESRYKIKEQLSSISDALERDCKIDDNSSDLPKSELEKPRMIELDAKWMYGRAIFV